MTKHVLGIDLGTTYTCVAISEGGNPRVLEQKGGYRTLPSIVAINKDGTHMVGHIAKRQAVTNPDHTIYGVKRFIGRNFDSTEVRRAIATFPYQIIEGADKDPRISVYGNEYPVPEVSAILLKQIKAIAEEALHEKIDKAVITVPAYFNDGQRQATKDAGIIAGLDVLRIVNEPTAASLAYGYNKKLNKKVAVYDLGGGTFDISVLDISQDTFEVLATSGNTYLGGEDFDQRIMDHVLTMFEHEHDYDLKQDKMAMQRLKDAAENAKCQLSTVLETEINLPFIATVNGQSQHLRTVLPRVELERLTSILVDETIKICKSAIKMAETTIEDIEDVILVGGMTRMPLVQQRVHDFFNKVPAKNVHPDEAVALGAAILGESLMRDENDVLLLDVTPLSLGIRTAGGLSSILIPRNSTIPTQEGQIFTTVKDNQEAVKIQVLQGENKNASENTFLGEFKLMGIEKAKAAEPKIEVNFAIDSDGIVQVTAKDQKTLEERSIVVTARPTLTDKEKHALEDKLKQEDETMMVKTSESKSSS